MCRVRLPWFLAAFLLLAVLAGYSEVPSKKAPSVQDKRANQIDSSVTRAARTFSSRVPSIFAALPMGFEPNEGQTDPQVKYVSHGSGYGIFLTQTETVLARQKMCEASPLQKLDESTRRRLEASKRGRAMLARYKSCQTAVLRMAIVGARPDAPSEPLGRLPGRSNYFIGANRSEWRTGIPTYSGVRFKGIRPGLDVTYYSNERQLEFDLAVSPGTDPRTIALKFPGQEKLRKNQMGDLEIGSGFDGVSVHRPLMYQIENGKKQGVQGEFVLLSDAQVGFHVGPYDRSKTLIIDPVVAYSTYLGGTTDGDSGVEDVAVDSSGNVYLAGWTSSTTFPVKNGYQTTGDTNYDAFVTELDPTGSTVLWSTYLGGTAMDEAFGIAIDANSNVYVTGFTLSTNFPISDGAFQKSNNDPTNGNAFVVRLDATKTGSASLVYSTYLGGGGNSSSSSGSWSGSGDTGLGIAVDSSGHAYVTGVTTSDASVKSFPTTSSAFQSTLASTNGNAFFTEIDTTQSGSASLLYSTYLGGNSPGWAGDYGAGVAIDGSGNAYIVGETTSTSPAPFPTTTRAYQTSLNGSGGNAFVAEIAPSKSGMQSLVYSTYFGGSTASKFGDSAAAVALDSTGKVYVAGGAESADFPVTTGAYQTTNHSTNGNAFIAKFDLTQSGSQGLVYSTLLGGTNARSTDSANAIGVDGSGDAFLAGVASSTDFPVTPDAYQPKLKSTGGWDAFLSELNPNGQDLLYSTYLGGSGSFGGFATGLAIDSLGNAYVAGYTQASDFPTQGETGTGGPFQTSGALNPDSGFLTKFAFHTDPGITATVSPQPNPAGWNNSPVTVTFTCISGAAPLQSCSSPVKVSSDGSGQRITGTVVDTANNTATATAIVNLDTTPPVVQITSPANNSIVTSTPFNVTGSVTDSLSGVSGVSCKGGQATVTGSTFSCSVPLVSGTNAIQVTAVDVAGNTTVATVSVNYVMGGGGAVASFVGSDTTTEGSWQGVYGADGYSIANDGQSIPSYASFAVQNQVNYTWAASTTDPRALQTGSGSGRIASTWDSSSSFNFDVNFTDGKMHQFAFYALDWDNLGRSEKVQVLDANTSAVLDTRNISGFSNGIYLIWNISGHVRINITWTGGVNAVVSGVFFGGGEPSTTVASFVGSDTSTEGGWQGVYGADGYSVASDGQVIPSYASFAVQNQLNYTWAASTTDPRALQTGSGSGRIASTWYNPSSFDFDVNFTDGKSHQFAFYAVELGQPGKIGERSGSGREYQCCAGHP